MAKRSKIFIYFCSLELFLQEAQCSIDVCVSLIGICFNYMSSGGIVHDRWISLLLSSIKYFLCIWNESHTYKQLSELESSGSFYIWIMFLCHTKITVCIVYKQGLKCNFIVLIKFTHQQWHLLYPYYAA